MLSFVVPRVVCGVGCAWVDLRLSRVRGLRKMALLRSVRTSFLTVFSQNMMWAVLVAWVNGVLV